jgi:hypothetical protein
MIRLSTRARLKYAGASGPLFAVLSLLWALLAGPAAGTASAAELTPAQKQDMKLLYEKATRAYDVGKYQEAIEEYQKAYEIGGDPPMLYNIAQSYRLNDQPGEAIRFYKRYLQRAPSARNREDVERKIADLEKGMEERRKAAAAVTPPPAAVTPVPAPVPTTPVTPSETSPAPSATTPSGGGPTESVEGAAPVRESQPMSGARKAVGWSLVGAGVVAGVLSVVEGQIARKRGDTLTNDSNTGKEFDPNIETEGKNANVRAIVLGIAGGAAIVSGVIVLLTGGGASEAAPAETTASRGTLTPWLGAGLVGAGASFRF